MAVRRQLLEQYVETQCSDVGCVDIAGAMETLNLGFCLGAFPAVHMTDDGRVVNVEGFVYDAEKRKFGFKKPKSKHRKPVAAEYEYDQDFVTNDADWGKPWIRILRVLLHIPDDPGSSVPSTMDAVPLFQLEN